MNKAKQFIYNFTHKDLFEILKSFYFKIPSIDKKVFFIIFALLNFAFIFHTVQFLRGDHDWTTVKEGLEWNYFFFSSRYSATSLKMLLTFGQILPVLNNVIGFFFYSLGIVLLLNYWEAPKNITQRALIGLTIAISPFTNVWLWFGRHTIENLSIPLFVVLGLMLSSSKNLWKNLLAIACFLYALGVYPSTLVTILTIFGTKIIIDLISDKFELKQTLSKNLNGFINIFVSLFSYSILVSVMKFFNISIDYVSNQHLPFNEVLNNIPKGILASFQQLINYHPFFMPHILTILFFIILVLIILFGLTKLFSSKISGPQKIKRFFICSGLLFIILLSTKTAAMLATEDVRYAVRVDFYGLMFLRGFWVLLVFKYGNILIKNIGYILVFLILWISILCNFFHQKVFYLSLNAEITRLSRIVYDIEHHPKFIPNKEYRIFVIGLPKRIMQDFVPEKFNTSGKNRDLTPRKMYTPNQFVSALSYYTMYKYGTEQNDYTELKDIIDELEPYPSKNYIYIKDDLMVLTFLGGELREVKEQIKSSE